MEAKTVGRALLHVVNPRLATMTACVYASETGLDKVFQSMDRLARIIEVRVQIMKSGT